MTAGQVLTLRRLERVISRSVGPSKSLNRAGLRMSPFVFFFSALMQTYRGVLRYVNHLDPSNVCPGMLGNDSYSQSEWTASQTVGTIDVLIAEDPLGKKARSRNCTGPSDMPHSGRSETRRRVLGVSKKHQINQNVAVWMGTLEHGVASSDFRSTLRARCISSPTVRKCRMNNANNAH